MVHAALWVFAEKGFAAAQLDDIAAMRAARSLRAIRALHAFSIMGPVLMGVIWRETFTPVGRSRHEARCSHRDGCGGLWGAFLRVVRGAMLKGLGTTLDQSRDLPLTREERRGCGRAATKRRLFMQQALARPSFTCERTIRRSHRKISADTLGN